MNEGKIIKKIEANCPCCLAGRDDIVYQNSGPIVRIYCTKCGLVCNESDAWKNGFKDVIDYWNHIGVYMPQDGEQQNKRDLDIGGYQTEDSVQALINQMINLYGEKK